MFSELLAGTETPVTTAAIKAAAIRIRQQGASTSAAATASVFDTDDLEEQVQQLRQQYILDKQQISMYQQEIQELRQQLAILQLQMIPEAPTGNIINVNYIIFY